LSWCDKLASTPTVGLFFNKHFASSSTNLDKLTPLLDKWSNGRIDNFKLTKQDSFGIELTTDNGFNYNIGNEIISVEFAHRMRIKPISGGYPIVEVLSKPEPYTKMLIEVSNRTLEASDLVIDPKTRSLTRIGIVSTTLVNKEEAPPGICRFIEYLSLPWGNEMEGYDFQVITNLNDSTLWSDRCIHQITKSDSEDGLITLRFDWQRIFKLKKTFTSIDSLRSSLDSAQKDSIEYLEQLAVGDRFNEYIDRKET